MWLLLAMLSASMLGCYDTFKKIALRDNAVIPVLFFNTFFCALFFLPFVLLSHYTTALDGSLFHVASGGWELHRYILAKSCLVLSSWLLGYFGMKHLPLTIVGPINATRPVMTLVGALLIFGERLNLYQWIGVACAIFGYFLLRRSSKREGINFSQNRWVYCIVVAAVLGATSGLYDKFLMSPVRDGGVGLDRMMVQSWYNIYQCGMMLLMLVILWWPTHRKTTPFHWRWSILGVSTFLSIADFAYFFALSQPEAMISVVSMIRRASVLVSFLFGAFLFREKNLRSKALDLILMFIGLLFLYFGSK